ncbi:MAG TPA: AAA family ATPase [Patescibacteria group bacterium]|nr:AAA family ATPase [Patescibacteria group bacterium]
MKPNLIVINGACGSGKTTLAQKYADNHPLTLCLNIDDVWKSLSYYRENRPQSAHLAKQIAIEMTKVNLNEKHDVVIAQIYRESYYLEELENTAIACGANFYEILLYLDKNEAVKRFIERGKSQGYADGFIPGNGITLDGREKALEIMYDEMMKAVSKRPNTIKIIPKLDDIDGTYAEIIKSTNTKK